MTKIKLLGMAAVYIVACIPLIYILAFSSMLLEQWWNLFCPHDAEFKRLLEENKLCD